MSEQPYESIGEAPVCEAPRRPWLVGLNMAGKRAIAFKPRCKSWSCPACAAINARLWGARAFFGSETIREAGRPLYFLTITSHESLSPEGTIKVFPQAWKTLRQRVIRKYHTFTYLMVPERHKSGRMHVHMLETAGAGERWWKDNARACGLGYMIDEQVMTEDGTAAFYVVKYLGKSIKDVDWPDGFRRVRISRDWPTLPEPEKVEGWTWRLMDPKLKLDDELTRIEQCGFSVQVLDHSTAWVYARAVVNEGEIPS